MGAGNWRPNGSEHNGSFFYINIPYFNEEEVYGSYREQSDGWGDDLITVMESILPKKFESSDGWKCPRNERHWGDDFYIIGDTEWYFCGLNWRENYVVCFIGLKDLDDSYWREQEVMSNLGHHAQGYSEKIYKELHRMGYEISFRSCAWTSSRYTGE